jgi:cytochrome c oxidase cbb3-type subunit 1
VFLDIVELTKKYLFTRSMAGILMTVGHLAFAVNFAWMLLRPRATQATAPTLFTAAGQLEVRR